MKKYQNFVSQFICDGLMGALTGICSRHIIITFYLLHVVVYVLLRSMMYVNIYNLSVSVVTR